MNRNKNKIQPPRFSEWLMKLLFPDRKNYSTIGDLREVYLSIVQDGGKRSANWWYRHQLIKTIKPWISGKFIFGGIMIKNYFKIAYRNIRNNKVYSSINILGFAFSLAAFILIALYVQHEVSYDKYHENGDRIFRAVRNKPNVASGDFTKTAVTPSPLAPLLVQEFPEIEKATRFIQDHDILISRENESFLESKIHWTDQETFEIFSIKMLMGDAGKALNDPHSIVLSKRAAIKYFGNTNPVGKILKLSEQFDMTVTGVFADMPSNSHFTMDIVLPIESYFKFSNRDINSWRGNFIYTYLLLKKGTDEQKLIAKFPAMFNKHIYEKFNINIEDKYKEVVTLQAITDIHLHSNRNQEIEANGDYDRIILLSSIAVLFLLIACINYMNLSTAKSSQRAKEVGLRKVVGANRWNLIRQFFSESLLTTLLAFIFSILFVILFLPMFNKFVGKSLHLNPSDDFLIFISLLVVVLFIGLIVGSYPALLISGFHPIAVLRGNYLKSSKGSVFRNIMVLVQFSITIFFISFTLIVRDQIQFISNKDAGYSKVQIINIKVQDPVIAKNLASVKEELLNHSDISNVSTSYLLPNYMDFHQSARWPGKEEGPSFMIYYNFADYNFTDVYDIEIIEGRGFSEEFPSDLNGAFLVNEAAVKAAQWKNPIGQELTRYGNVTGKIVGVMKDFHFHSFHRPIEPAYIFLDPGSIKHISVKLSGSRIPETIKYIENVIKNVSPKYPFEYAFFDEVFAAQYQNEQKLGSIFSAFSILAVIVACLGLYGLSSFAAENRTKEIGIRKSMGASISNIIFLLSKEFLRWVVLANIIAWPISYYFIENWLNDFVYRTNVGLEIFGLAGMLALIIAIITVSYQSIKSARMNPVESLKYE